MAAVLRFLSELFSPPAPSMHASGRIPSQRNPFTCYCSILDSQTGMADSFPTLYGGSDVTGQPVC